MTAAGSVLITGCSSGIGQAAALALHEAGRTVVATARKPDTLSGLAGRGLRTLALDVTDESSMRAAVDAAGPSTSWSTTPGTACTGPSSSCRWRRSGASSRRTSSAWSG